MGKGTTRLYLQLLLAAGVAFLLVQGFAAILGPGRERNFPDQVLYEHLGRTLASTGSFGRYVTDDLAIPEALRSIGYPAFLAALFRTFGTSYLVIVIAQGLLLATLPPAIFFTARRFLSERLSLVCAWAVALYPPLAYYAALSLSDFFASYVFTLGILTLVRVYQRDPVRRAILSGSLFGWAAITRPSLIAVSLPLAIWLLGSAMRGRGLPRSAAIAFFAALLIFPGLSAIYTKVNFDRSSIVATGPGQALWLGYWQGMWPGRVHNEIVRLDLAGASRTVIEDRVKEISGDPSRVAVFVEQQRALTFVHGDLAGQTAKELEAERLALGFALTNIRDDLAGYLTRALTYRTFAFWASEVPTRYDQIDGLPRPILIAIWAPQIALVLLAAVGAITSIGGSAIVQVLTLAVVSIWLVHLPFLAQPRFSLPVKAIVLVLAVVGAAWLLERRGLLQVAASSLVARSWAEAKGKFS